MNIAVYCGSNFGSDFDFEKRTRELGHWMADQNHMLVYGGGNCGLMGVIAQSVMEKDGDAIGVIPEFLLEREQAYDDLNELYIVETMAQRKTKMIELADAFIALPGGPGTLEEISEIMSSVRLDQLSGPCILYNMNHFYDSLIEYLDKMVECKFLTAEDRNKYQVAENLSEIQQIIEG